MRNLLLTALILAGSLRAQQAPVTAFIQEGAWSICAVVDTAGLCAPWHAAGNPIWYELYIVTTTDATAYSYTVTAMLNGVPIVRSGMVKRTDIQLGSRGATNVQFSFGGAVTDLQVSVQALGVIGQN